eukprot:COSAG01_NODE_1398_length_10466_cov_173.518086_2_plen_352_part_00
MAYPAYLMNGAMSLLGCAIVASAVVVLEDSTTAVGAFTLCVGFGYVVFGGLAVFSVAQNQHMLLRLSNIFYLGSCPVLLILGLIAAVYSGQIENVLDFYSNHWCKLRFQLENTDPDYCLGLGDAACKKKIIDDSTSDIELLGIVILVALLAIITLIVFTLRLARKFKFDSRNFGSEREFDDDPKDSDADDEDASDGMVSSKRAKVELALVVVPTVAVIVSIVILLISQNNHTEVSANCGMLSAAAVIANGTDAAGILVFDGAVAFQHKKGAAAESGAAPAPPPPVEVDVNFIHRDQVASPYQQYVRLACVCARQSVVIASVVAVLEFSSFRFHPLVIARNLDQHIRPMLVS